MPELPVFGYAGTFPAAWWIMVSVYIRRFLPATKTAFRGVGQGLLVSGFLLFSGAAAWAQGLPPELQQAWRATRLPESALSLVVKEIDGPTLASVNPAIARNPASVMKMVT